MPTPQAIRELAPKPGRKYRLAAAALLFVALLVAGKVTGLGDKLDVEALRVHVAQAGALGIVVYVAAFAGGLLLHMPGIAFVVAGVLLYGKVAGFALALMTGVLAVSVSFVVVRTVGGTALAQIDRPFVKKIMARLEERPITTVILLRTVFWLATPLNYALALSSVRLRDYVIGSFLGLIAPLLGITLLLEWIFT
jgi:uncharacterized membrane protein YdjX (TVP38/TMEM64 family)